MGHEIYFEFVSYSADMYFLIGMEICIEISFLSSLVEGR